jgi:hypothetical protein
VNLALTYSLQEKWFLVLNHLQTRVSTVTDPHTDDERCPTAALSHE